MSFNFMQWLEDAWNKTHKIDPLGHKAVEGMVKQGSRGAEHLGNFLGWDYLAQEGKKNQENPVRGIARGSVAAAGGYGAAAAWPYLAGAGAGTQTAGGLAATTAAGQLAAGAADTALGNYGALTQEQLIQLALERAKQEAATQAIAQTAVPEIAKAGMFSQIPGAGAQQAAMLAEQTAPFGGQGANLTADAAMGPIKDAYARGQMGTLDYLGNVAKSDMAGMDDPRVWLDRLGKNAGRLSNASRTASLVNALSPKPSGYQPVAMPRGQAQIPEQVTSSGDSQQKLLADFKAGRITEEELRRKLGAMGVYA